MQFQTFLTSVTFSEKPFLPIDTLHLAFLSVGENATIIIRTDLHPDVVKCRTVPEVQVTSLTSQDNDQVRYVMYKERRVGCIIFERH